MSTLQKQIPWVIKAQWAIGATSVLLIGAFVLEGYRPATARIASLRGQILQQQRDLAAGRTQTVILPSVTGDIEHLRAKLDRYKTPPHLQEMPELFREIAQLANRSALTSYELKPGKPTRDEHFNQLPVQISFDGDFVGVFAFLQRVEALQRLSRIRGLVIHAADKQGQVHVQLGMNIYFAAE